MPANHSTRTRRLVLKQRDWTEASRFAEQHSWPEEPAEDSGTGRKSMVWSLDEDTVFQVTRDRTSGEFCCFFYGSDRDELVRLLGEAEQELDVWRIPELLNEPYEETDPRMLVQSIFRLGLGAPPVHSLSSCLRWRTPLPMRTPWCEPRQPVPPPTWSGRNCSRSSRRWRKATQTNECKRKRRRS